LLILIIEDPVETILESDPSNILLKGIFVPLSVESLNDVRPTTLALVVVPMPVNSPEISSISSTLLETMLIPSVMVLFPNKMNFDNPLARVSSVAISKSSFS
jgi:hypothetical protein